MRIVALALAGAAVIAAAPVPYASLPLAAGSALVLSFDGFVAAGKTARFDTTSKSRAIALASAALGAPLRKGSHGDCGQGGVIEYAQFRGGFELSFINDKLSGWTADKTGPKTSKGIAVGSTLDAVRKAYPDVDVDTGDETNGGMGPGFQREAGPNGWLDGTKPASKVTGLFAGATCLAGL